MEHIEMTKEDKAFKELEEKLNNPIEPSHYTELKISPLDYITANEGEFSWCIANVIKYVSRYKRKNGLEDLKKAQWYLNEQIRIMESDSTTSSSK